MSTTVEPVLGLEWLAGVLQAMATQPAGGWHQIAPSTAVSPYGIVRQLTAAPDLTALNEGRKIWTDVTFQVILYDREKPNYQRISPIAAAVYDALQGQSATLADGQQYGCHRTYVNASFETVGDVVERFIEQQFHLLLNAE